LKNTNNLLKKTDKLTINLNNKNKNILILDDDDRINNSEESAIEKLVFGNENLLDNLLEQLDINVDEL